MTRVVAKAGQDELVVTSAQPGVLYVSGLPVEKNIFEGLRRKLATIGQAFDIIHGRRATVEVYESSSCRVALPDASIDYAFTDPPFGGNIPYAEVNFINEAWLGRLTNRADEVIISDSQGKTSVEYADMLTQALSEVNRILKPEGKATLIFHSASSEVWNALQSRIYECRLRSRVCRCSEQDTEQFQAGYHRRSGERGPSVVARQGAVRGRRIPVLVHGLSQADSGKNLSTRWTQKRGRPSGSIHG